MDDDDYGSPPPPAPGRSMDIELHGQEIVTIDLDRLEPNPEDIIDLLVDANAKINKWTKLAWEYWKGGLLDGAESIALKAIQQFSSSGEQASLPPIYHLLANIQLARARKAPKIHLENARQDNVLKEKAKEYYHQQAAQYLNTGDAIARENEQQNINAFLTRGIHQLSRTALDDAFASFEAVLAEKKSNIVALLGKARILYARKQYPKALRLFQQVLTLAPDTCPDPRIGIGLCFWALDQKEKARMCWERSVEVHPDDSWAANLLLGLEAINASKDPQMDDDEARASAYVKGTKLLERSFKANNKNAATANALCSYFRRRGEHRAALKLAERTIQFADILALFASGHIHAGTLAQAEAMAGNPSRLQDASKHFQAALKGSPKHVLAAIGLSQVQISSDDIPAAIHTLDALLQPPNPQKHLEVQVLLASLRAFPRAGMSASDLAAERSKARELYENVLKALDVGTSGLINTKAVDEHTAAKARALFGEDVELFVEAAKLWQDENREKMRRILEEAVRAVQARQAAGGKGEPRLINNLAVLKHLDGEPSEARSMYEQALTEASAVSGKDGDAMTTTILYNLARAYEDSGDSALAQDAYSKLISRHPEYVDAKVRQAYLLRALNKAEEAHELLKAAQSSAPKNLEVRAALTHFLVGKQLVKPAKDFVVETLKNVDAHDVYSLCALGWIQFHTARENRDASQKGQEERRRGYQRSAEFYERALQLDERCAFAAQGLAIITAEDVLGALRPVMTSSAEESARRLATARDALDIFAKVRECISDPSVYINMGHCFFVREEFDRAIESYETALKRYHTTAGAGTDVTIVHNLCRAWYAKAQKDQIHAFTSLQNALRYAQMAQHIHPSEKANVYNIAMIMQKVAEMLFAIPPAKRTLRDLEKAVQQAVEAQKLFASLAADKAQNVPYDRDIADQRRKYGESLLRRGDEHIAKQREHEAAQEEKLAAARARRQEEKERVEKERQEREEELRRRAEVLAESRRKAREEAQQWTAAMTGDSDEEKEKRPRKGARKQRSENVSAAASGDEGAAAGGVPPEPKKRRKGKLRKEGGDVGGDVSEEEAVFSGDEAEDRPKKRSQKKRMVRDDDDEETAAVSAPRKKQFKSKEMISDSDEEMS